MGVRSATHLSGRAVIAPFYTPATFRIEDGVPAESLIRFAIYKCEKPFARPVRHASTDPRRVLLSLRHAASSSDMYRNLCSR